MIKIEHNGDICQDGSRPMTSITSATEQQVSKCINNTDCNSRLMTNADGFQVFNAETLSNKGKDTRETGSTLSSQDDQVTISGDLRMCHLMDHGQTTFFCNVNEV